MKKRKGKSLIGRRFTLLSRPHGPFFTVDREYKAAGFIPTVHGVSDDGKKQTSPRVVDVNWVAKNPIKRKKKKHLVRRKHKKAISKCKPKITRARKNPRPIFKNTKSRQHSSYTLRGKFHGFEHPYYMGDDERFYRRPTNVRKFNSEDAARSYVFRMKSSLSRKFPMLNTIQVVRAK